MGVTTKSILEMIVEEANERFYPTLKLHKEHYNILCQYCDIIDVLNKEFDSESVDIEVNEETLDIIFEIECGDVVIRERNHVFYELIKHTISHGFSATDEGLLKITLVFPGIWEKI